MKFIHTADVHYGRAFGGRNPQKQADIAETFGRMIDFANSNNVDFILCAGDLIESDAATLSQLKSLRDEIRRFKGKFYSVSGNHDPLSNISVYEKVDFPENFILFPPDFSSLDLGDFTLHGFSWETKSISEPLNHPFAMGKKNILLIHADTASNSVYLPVTPQYLKSLGMDYIALGHIHKPSFIADNIAYCGSLEPLDSSETGAHGFILCEFDEKLKAQFIPFSKTTYAEQELTVTPDFSDVTLKSEISGIIEALPTGTSLRLTLNGRFSPLSPLDVKTVESSFENVTIIDETSPDYDFELLLRENEGNIIGRFISSFGDISTLSAIERRALEYGIEALLYSEKQNERNSAK